MTRRLFWASAAVGWTVMIAGFVGLADEGSQAPVGDVARWVVGLALTHDLLLVPAVLIVGAVAVARVPATYRPAVEFGLVVSAPIALFALPAVRGYGRLPDNPSILPNDYATGLSVVLGGIWVAVGFVLVRTWIRRRSRRHPLTRRELPSGPRAG